MALLLRSAEAQPYLPRFVWFFQTFFFLSFLCVRTVRSLIHTRVARQPPPLPPLPSKPRPWLQPSQSLSRSGALSPSFLVHYRLRHSGLVRIRMSCHLSLVTLRQSDNRNNADGRPMDDSINIALHLRRPMKAQCPGQR